MKRVLVNLAVFLAGAASLVISLKLFYNMAIYSDEYNSSPVLVCGGEFWLLMDWVRMGLLALMTLLSGVSLLVGRK